MRYKKVKSIEKIYTSEQGCTQPALVQLDDGTKAVLKYAKNPFGEIVLVNEFIAYSIAKTIELSCPNFGIAKVDSSTSLPDTGLYNIKRFEGMGFYCQYIPSTVKASTSVLNHVKNLNETCKLILFDLIVKNSDRHASNVIITTNSPEPKMFTIDYSHAFGDPQWDSKNLCLNDALDPYILNENLDLYNMLRIANAPMEAHDFEEATQKIKNCITANLLDKIIKEIPEEWSLGLDQNNFQLVKAYILYRVNNLNKICDMIINEGRV